jgi:hypothetical protein
MNDLPFVRRFLRMLVEPGWAPFAVVFLHVVLAEFGLTQRFDHLLHFLGGIAIGYFFFRLFELLLPFPTGYRWLIYPATFACSCTAALFWELAEFASDVFLHTSVQQSLSETMLDLLFGVLGGTSSLALLAFISLLRHGRSAKVQPVPPVSKSQS